MLAKHLLNPTTNRIIADLDNTASMSSIVMRDLIDNAGRMTQAYQRDPHEGKEEAIEQNVTTLIWGFGIRYLKKLFDSTSKQLANKGMGNIHLPELNMALLDKGPQQLTEAVIQKYTPADSPLRTHLTDLIQNKKGLIPAYQSANVLKFGVATFLPVLLIAFGIPTLKQWMTRNKLQEEKKALPQSVPPSFGSLYPQRIRAPKNFQPFSQRLQISPESQQTASSPRFSGMNPLNGMYHLLQNERANTLLIDGTISGGRTYKARNIYERLEILFSEAMVIYFLFFAATPIQSTIQKSIDRIFGIHTQLEFQGLKKIYDTYSPQGQTLLKHLQAIEQEFGTFQSFQGLKSSKTKEILAAFEKQVVPKARDYIHNGLTDHLLFDLAQHCDLIPTKKTPDGKIRLDITQKIQTDTMYRLGQNLKRLVTLAEGKGQAQAHGSGLRTLIKQSLVGKLGAFGLTIAICTAFLGWIIPKAKQQITYTLTGKDQFPGRLNDGERQDFLSVHYP